MALSDPAQVSTRELSLDVTGQEIMTADKVTLRLNAVVTYKIADPLMVVTAVPLLVITLFFGKSINEANRWLEVPVIGLTFQTSDFAKLALIMYLARGLSQKQDEIKDFYRAFLPLIIPTGIICILIMPEDLSTALILLAPVLAGAKEVVDLVTVDAPKGTIVR